MLLTGATLTDISARVCEAAVKLRAKRQADLVAAK
jgi:hypothetical protein